LFFSNIFKSDFFLIFFCFYIFALFIFPLKFSFPDTFSLVHCILSFCFLSIVSVFAIVSSFAFHVLLKFTSFYSFLPGSFFSFSKHNCYLMLILIFLYSNISSKTKTTACYQFCLQANNLINKITLNCVHIKNMFKERSRSFYYIFSSAFAAHGHIVL
jgi:hypothetical protein